MTPDQYRAYRDQTLQRWLRGEIGKAEYDELDAKIRELETSSASAETPTPAYEPGEATRGAATVPRVAAVAPPQPGDQIGKYRLVSALRGGMGVVWKAEDTKNDHHQVALKLLPPELLGNPEEIGRIKQAYNLVRKLAHPHICTVRDLDEDSRWGWYQVMDWVEGRTFSRYRDEKAGPDGLLPVQMVANLLRPVAVALDFAHSQGVLHRDIKPQNLMLDREGRVQVIDFGLAAEVRSSLTRMSRKADDGAGTLPYLSPEQWEGKPASPLSDQYALGITAYQMICGSYPFQSDHAAVLARLVLEKEVPPIAGLPEAVNAVLRKVLAKQPQDRYPNCREFMKKLEVASQVPSSLPQPRLDEPTPTPSLPTPNRPSKLKPPPQRDFELPDLTGFRTPGAARKVIESASHTKVSLHKDQATNAAVELLLGLGHLVAVTFLFLDAGLFVLTAYSLYANGPEWQYILFLVAHGLLWLSMFLVLDQMENDSPPRLNRVCSIAIALTAPWMSVVFPVSPLNSVLLSLGAVSVSWGLEVIARYRQHEKVLQWDAWGLLGIACTLFFPVILVVEFQSHDSSWTEPQVQLTPDGSAILKMQSAATPVVADNQLAMSTADSQASTPTPLPTPLTRVAPDADPALIPSSTSSRRSRSGVTERGRGTGRSSASAERSEASELVADWEIGASWHRHQHRC